MTALHEKAAPGGADDDRAAENGSHDHVADDRATSESIGYGGAFDDYDRRGWPSMVPVPRPAKKPPPTGYTGRHGRIPSYADMCTWGQERPDDNIALVFPDDVAGIDVDAYNGKTGGQTLAESEKRCGKLPPTYRSTSRDDGVSGIRLFRVPAGTVLRDEITFPELGIGGIDIIQHDHRYAMVSPSVHPSGAVYRWFDEIDMSVMDQPPAVGDLPDLPAKWLEMLRKIEPARNGAETGTERPNRVVACMAHNDIQPWFQAAFDGEIAKLASAGEGNREKVCNAVLLRLYRLHLAGGFTKDMVDDAAWAAGRMASANGIEPFTDSEIRQKMGHCWDDAQAKGPATDVPDNLDGNITEIDPAEFESPARQPMTRPTTRPTPRSRGRSSTARHSSSTSRPPPRPTGATGRMWCGLRANR
jgi:hypothetical protein